MQSAPHPRQTHVKQLGQPTEAKQNEEKPVRRLDEQPFLIWTCAATTKSCVFSSWLKDEQSSSGAETRRHRAATGDPKIKKFAPMAEQSQKSIDFC